MKRVRVGVVGCGGVAQMMHLPFLRELDQHFEIAALCDLSPGVLQSVGSHYGVAARYTDFNELASHDLDAVLVLTPGSHAPAAIAAATAGRHVLVEKPMCFTLREADEMIATAKEHNVTLMVAYMKRFDPGYLLAQQAVQKLRHPRAVEVHIWHPSEPQYLGHHRIDRANDVPKDVLDRLRIEYDALVREAVGDVPGWLNYAYAEVLLGSIIHDINALRGLIGAPDKVLSTEIWAEGNAIMSTFQYGEDVRGVLTWTFLDDVRNYREDLAFLATDGRVELRFPSPFLKNVPTPLVVELMEDGVYTRREHHASFEEAFKQELLHFHECVTTGRHPLTDGAEGKLDIAQAIEMFNAFKRN
ncbi:MAG: Myo-inositol-2-dehydrogenase [Chloroflexi bacterium]|nr:Myo-inositol-2-dehydrogenase [Chloroflexota bacterium]